ncbi:carbohydrate ABC transporter permease [Allobranchiibius sp. GilTou73]|uniref:carbohydrate ABC transporter permease n=1 Tax=Allobranchiibius sp. GilTou73 TaxID=2904523 RepID=UPI001F2A1B08|nr:carbohydrate ABC transporter permease [Allobranchiibius sp. GilTou73]UIJ33838.1 carbohydrate ABC transporter permease [Allobranchiibius sp. GilTou73]
MSTMTRRIRSRRSEVHNAEAMSHSGPALKTFGYLAMIVTVLIVAVPLFWIVVTSFKERPDIFTQPAQWWPRHATTDGYHNAVFGIPFGDYLRNSLIITGILSTTKIILGVISAYALSLLRFPGRNLVFIVVIAALMVPNQITVISNYALVSQLGWRNTYQGIIIPLAGVAFGTFLMRNQFLSIPTEIIEAARLDGAGPLKLLWRVALPMSWPTLVAFSIITVVNEWNEYLWPFLMSDDSRTGTLPIGLTFLQTTDGITNWGPVMAATVLAMLPVLVVFLVLQRHMIKGLTAGAVKG